MSKSRTGPEQTHSPSGEGAERRIRAHDHNIRMIVSAPERQRPAGNHPDDANRASQGGAWLESRFPDPVDLYAPPNFVPLIADGFVTARSIRGPDLHIQAPITQTFATI